MKATRFLVAAAIVMLTVVFSGMAIAQDDVEVTKPAASERKGPGHHGPGDGRKWPCGAS